MRMKASTRKGFSFGLTSGIITTLGMIVGLNSGTHSRAVVLGGILLIAIADSLSDALGIHIAEEAEKGTTTREVWRSTFSTLLSKLVVASTFIIPVLLLQLSTAIVVSVLWGLSLISVLSYHIAKRKNIKPYKLVAEHLIIAILVIIITHYIGELIATFV